MKLDFVEVKKEFVAKSQRYVYRPAFIAKRTQDIMVRSRDFYAIYDEATGFWSLDENKAIELIDDYVMDYVRHDVGEDVLNDKEHCPIVKRLSDTDSGMIDKFHHYVQHQLRDNYETLNQKVIFSNMEVKRKDYSSFALDYPLIQGETPYYNKLVDTLYTETERQKFEWAVGCVLAGDQSKIQKLFVFFGAPGSGKSTIINKVIVNSVFGGTRAPYTTKFTAGLLVSKDSFGTGFLSQDPVLAFDDDADLSRIDDNTTLNLIVSHEGVRVNEKFKAPYTSYPNCILICGTNEPVQLSPSSGMNRRLIDIRQTGNHLSPDEYDEAISHLEFEKSGIAYHCLDVYKSLGKNYYNHYAPEDMLSMTSPFHNFVKDSFFQIKDGVTLANAYKLYCDYCTECNYKTIISRYKFRDSLKLYFNSYADKENLDGKIDRNFFSDFKYEKIGIVPNKPTNVIKDLGWLLFDATKSIFDTKFALQPAQYTMSTGTPISKWDNVTTTLRDLDTSKLHYVKVPKNLVVLDFDIKDVDGNKSYELNRQAAEKFPPTYAELSKSGTGIHLHYIYKGGDPKELSRLYGDNVEIKVFTGNASLRRKLTKCNTIDIKELSSGLPKKGGSSVIDKEGFENEKKLRALIAKAINKQIHPNTKPNIDFINKLLTDAYQSGKDYDVSDLLPTVLEFATDSTNHSTYCTDLVFSMPFKSKDSGNSTDEFLTKIEGTDEEGKPIYVKVPNPDFVPIDNHESEEYSKAPIIFLDCEIFPNLFLVNWKFQGPKQMVRRMINPTPKEIEDLFKYRIIGFNNRSYDNHMLYARSQGYTVEELYKLSRRIIVDKDKNAKFRNAYNLSYTDILDFAAADNKQSLKKWEIQLGLLHKEWDKPWDQPVPESDWGKVAEYCDNDVIATEAVFNYLQPDFEAREILAQMSGLTVDDTTNSHTIRILTNGIKDPKSQYVYTNLAEMKDKEGNLLFPGYEYDPNGIDKSRYNEGTKIVAGRSIYKGEDPGEGGYALGNPGIYYNVDLMDIASMHPHSAIALGIFGKEMTKRLENLVEGRIAVKHIREIGDENYISAVKRLGEVVEKAFVGLKTPAEIKSKCKALANALKTAINSVYGLTSAGFDNELRDPRNIDNIVAKYGALVMINLKYEVQRRGYTVVHIKTDSIKIADSDPTILSFVKSYGKKYGYSFEHEAKFDKMCIVNHSVYVAHQVEADEEKLKAPIWTATGAQFQIPYVFKTLFSHETIEFEDYCETKSVQKGELYLDFNEELVADQHDYRFIGRVGRFCPVKPGCGGGVLYRFSNDKYYAASGTKGYRWLEAIVVSGIKYVDIIDLSYYRTMVDKAVDTISKYGDFNKFVSEDPIQPVDIMAASMKIPADIDEELPWD